MSFTHILVQNGQSIKMYSKTCVKRLLSKSRKMVFKTIYRLMQVKSVAECSKGEPSAILSTFTKLPFVIEIYVLSIFEWPFFTGFTVQHKVDVLVYET